MDSEKKEKLLRAATELFARNGYDGVSIREISEAAGVNSAMISYYFGGKRGLYSAALIAQLEELRDFLSLDAEALDPRAVFRRYAETACAIHEQNPYLLQYIYREFIAASGSAPLPFAKAVFPVYRILLRAAEKGMAEGLFRPELDAPSMVLLFAGAVNFHFLSADIRRRMGAAASFPEERAYIRQTLDIFFRGIERRDDS